MLARLLRVLLNLSQFRKANAGDSSLPLAKGARVHRHGILNSQLIKTISSNNLSSVSAGSSQKPG